MTHNRKLRTGPKHNRLPTLHPLVECIETTGSRSSSRS